MTKKIARIIKNKGLDKEKMKKKNLEILYK